MDKYEKFLILFLIFYFFLLIRSFPEPIVSDEGDHMMDSFFFYNLIRDTASNPKILLNIQKYVYRFYTFYPALYIIYYPPLFSIITAFSYIILGPSMFSARIVTALFSIATLIIFYLLGRKLYDKKTSFLSVIILSFASFYFIFSTIAMLEVPLMFFILLSILFFFKGIEDDPKYFYIMGICLGIGSLIKYSIFSIAPGLFFYLIYKKLLFRNFKTIFISGLISILIFIPYLILLFHFNGLDYILYVINGKHQECYDICPPKNSISFLYYYPFFLFFEVFPLVFLLPIIYLLYKRKLNESDIFLIFLIFFYFVSFTILSNKTPKYIMVTIPLFSLLFTSVLRRIKKSTTLLFILVVLIQFLISVFYTPYGLTETSHVMKFNSEKPATYLVENIKPKANVFLMGSFYDDGVIFNFARLNNFENHLLRWRPCFFENITQNEFENFIKENNIQFVLSDETEIAEYIRAKEWLNKNFQILSKQGNMIIYENPNLEINDIKEICDYICKINKKVCSKLD